MQALAVYLLGYYLVIFSKDATTNKLRKRLE